MRRLLKTALVVLLCLALGLALLPWLARPLVAGALSAAVGQPVSIAALRWDTAQLSVVAQDVRIGEAPLAVTIPRIVVAADPRGLGLRHITLQRVGIEAPAGNVDVEALRGQAAAAEPPRAPLLPIAMTIREVVVSDAALSLQAPADVGVAVALVVTRATATDVELGRRRTVDLRADMAGTVDGAPLTATAEVHLAPDAQRVAGSLSLRKLPVRSAMLPLPPTVTSVAGTVDANAKFAVGDPAGSAAVQLDVQIANAAVETTRGAGLRATRVAMPAARVDLTKRRIDLGAVEVREPVVAIDLAALAAPPAATAASAPAWAVRSAAVSVRGGDVQLRRGEARAGLHLERVRWDGLRDEAAPLSLTATVTGGGSVAVEGTVRAEPPTADLTVRADGVVAAPWAALVDLPLQLTRGTVGGAAQLAYRDGLRSVSGDLRIADLHTRPPDPARPTEILAVANATAAFSYAPGNPATIDVSSATLSYPYAMAVRSDAGTFPFTAMAPAPSRDAGAGAPPRLRIAQVTVENGKLEFVDATLTPPFWTSLTDVTASASDVAIPPGTVDRFTLAGKRDELSPVLASGSISPEGLDGRVQVTDVLLDSLNPYIAPRLGYRITSGRLSTVATARPQPPLLISVAELVLNGVDVLQTGTDVILEQSGVPLPVALSLIADVGGQIDLKLPFSIDTTSGDVAIGSVVWQAVRKAIVSALTSPLRILGSLFGIRGAPHAFAVEPIPFAAGSAVLDAPGRERVRDIARIVQAHAGLLVVLLPQVTDGDIAALGAAGAAALARDRNAAARDAFIAAGVPAKRLLPSPWDAEKAAKATGRPGVYVELQDGS